MSEMLANQMMDQNDSLRRRIDQFEHNLAQAGEIIAQLFKERKCLIARKKALLTENRRLRRMCRERKTA